jgi:hypothetical protein
MSGQGCTAARALVVDPSFDDGDAPVRLGTANAVPRGADHETVDPDMVPTKRCVSVRKSSHPASHNESIARPDHDPSDLRRRVPRR